METLHKSDCGLHNEPAFKQTNCDCGAIEKPFVSFETEYRLEQFKSVQGQYFDKYNVHFTDYKMDATMAESMLKLIDQMALEIKKYAQFTNDEL